MNRNGDRDVILWNMARVYQRMLVSLLLILYGSCLGGRVQAQGSIQLRTCLDSCDVAERAGAYLDALRFAERAVREAADLPDRTVLASVLIRRSGIRQMNGDLNGALSDLHEALRIYEAVDEVVGKAKVFNAIGAIHHDDGNYDRALTYYRQSLGLRKLNGTPADRAVLYGNLGSVMEELGVLDSALFYHRLNLTIRKGMGEPSWNAVCFANLGECFDKAGEGDSALHYLEASLALLGSVGDEYRRSHVLTLLGMVQMHRGDPAQAISYCKKSLALAEELDNLPLKQSCYDCLYQAYRNVGRSADALRSLEAYSAARDSLFGAERAKENIRIEMEYQFEREQIADSLARLEEQRKAKAAYQKRLAGERDQKHLFLVGTLAVLVFSGGLWSRLHHMRKSRNIIQYERDRSDRLLLNILPKPIADELKEYGRAQAKEVDGVSILFTDFHGFTKMSECLSAQELVAEIDMCFRAFDGIAARHGLEKIKTIGDAYMAAAGLPEPHPKSAVEAVRAALEMQDWVKARAAERTPRNLPCFSMRVGIHTGEVVAGIVGDSKFQYDVWGDTVNTAAHMESSGAVGEVNISAATYALVRDEQDLVFSPRGRVMAKGKGQLDMYFVGRRSALSGPAELMVQGELV